MTPPLSHDRNRDLLLAEGVERVEEGAEPLEVEQILADVPPSPSQGAFRAAWERLRAVPIRADWPFREPSRVEEMPHPDEPLPIDRASLPDRIHAAWLGRCAGCLLGKPFEGLDRDAIRQYLDAHDAYPLLDYVPPPTNGEDGPFPYKGTTRGSIDGMPRDDDLDYTILNLGIAERCRRALTPEDVAVAWLEKLPYLQVYTAERQAYHNLVDGFAPPASAVRYNPYREWIGAQIRADLWGYISPGDPAGAARLAWIDASISHTKNGLYGAMFFAGLIAAALGETTLDDALDRAEGVIPPESRFAAMVRTVRAQHAEGQTWDRTLNAISREYGTYHWIHTINNAAVVVAALLHGQGNFSRTIGLAVTAGWDTDCNGATAGSILGALHGTTGIPNHWTAPLDDRIETAVVGAGGTHIAALGSRTTLLAMRSVGEPMA